MGSLSQMVTRFTHKLFTTWNTILRKRLTDIVLQGEVWGGLDLAIFRVLGVRQNSHINK